MKRLLLGPALIAPLALFGCNWGTKVPELPKVEVPAVVRQIPLEDFEHFPPVKIPDAAPAPVKKPTVRHRPATNKTVRHHAAPPTHSTRTEGASPEAAERLPPQQGPICIFPLNMIPNCTPQVAQ